MVLLLRQIPIVNVRKAAFSASICLEKRKLALFELGNKLDEFSGLEYELDMLPGVLGVVLIEEGSCFTAFINRCF